jgi:hypothetical protein
MHTHRSCRWRATLHSADIVLHKATSERRLSANHRPTACKHCIEMARKIGAVGMRLCHVFLLGRVKAIGKNLAQCRVTSGHAEMNIPATADTAIMYSAVHEMERWMHVHIK